MSDRLVTNVDDKGFINPSLAALQRKRGVFTWRVAHRTSACGNATVKLSQNTQR